MFIRDKLLSDKVNFMNLCKIHNVRSLYAFGSAVAGKFDMLHPEMQLEDARKIVGFQYRIIHTYDDVDSSMIWTIIQRYLKTLHLLVCFNKKL